MICIYLAKPNVSFNFRFDAQNYNIDKVKLLIDNGANINCKDRHGWTPIHIATITSDQMVDVMELLIFHGAEVNAKDDQLRTPLHFAARNVQPEAVKLLMKHGADPHAKDQNGQTPIDYLRQRIITDTEVDSYKVFEMISI